jgi:hypothetical protein
LERDLDLRTQSLDEEHARNQALEQQLNGERRRAEDVRIEIGRLMGEIAEKDRVTSIQ